MGLGGHGIAAEHHGLTACGLEIIHQFLPGIGGKAFLLGETRRNLGKADAGGQRSQLPRQRYGQGGDP